jgi:hypothetical protein
MQFNILDHFGHLFSLCDYIVAFGHYNNSILNIYKTYSSMYHLHVISVKYIFIIDRGNSFGAYRSIRKYY